MTDSVRLTGFPHYRGFWPFRFQAGWQDLGEMDSEYIKSDGWNSVYKCRIHAFCGSNLHVGCDADGSLFRFCPRCLMKTHD